MKAKSYFSFGNSLHRTLEKFAQRSNEGVDVEQQLQVIYDESWIDAGYSSSDEMAEAYGEGIEILNQAKEDKFWVPESGETLAVEKQMRLDMGEFVLVGRIDRLDQHADGTLEIVDFKSGRSQPTEEEAKFDIALCCYQLLVRRAYPDHAVKASLIGLRERVKVTTSLSDEEMDEFEFSLRELGNRILNHEYYEMEPVHKQLCSSCDFLKLCRRHSDFCENS